MNILSLTSHAYMPQFRGGIETVIFDLDAEFKKRKHNHEILARLYSGDFLCKKTDLKQRFSEFQSILLIFGAKI